VSFHRTVAECGCARADSSAGAALAESSAAVAPDEAPGVEAVEHGREGVKAVEHGREGVEVGDRAAVPDDAQRHVVRVADAEVSVTARDAA
jgi:hypothetical protein